MPRTYRQCYADHMGLWHIEPTWFNQAFQAVKDGIWVPRESHSRLPEFTFQAVVEGRVEIARESYDILENGVAVIPLHGHMTKAGDSFGGGSTLETRQAIRAADRDNEVKTVVVHFDTPGGHVAGTDALARDFANVSKPKIAHLEDLTASAGYFVASQADLISASPMTEVGSIGTLLVVADYSGLAEREGVTVHTVSTGAYKGAGVPGTRITEEHLAYFQERVDNLNGHFLDAVGRGRGLAGDALATVADGRVFIAQDAQRLGLVDVVQPFDATLSAIGRAM